MSRRFRLGLIGKKGSFVHVLDTPYWRNWGLPSQYAADSATGQKIVQPPADHVRGTYWQPLRPGTDTCDRYDLYINEIFELRDFITRTIQGREVQVVGAATAAPTPTAAK